jgi:low affinity Fe/Cu permease
VSEQQKDRWAMVISVACAVMMIFLVFVVVRTHE